MINHRENIVMIKGRGTVMDGAIRDYDYVFSYPLYSMN